MSIAREKWRKLSLYHRIVIRLFFTILPAFKRVNNNVMFRINHYWISVALLFECTLNPSRDERFWRQIPWSHYSTFHYEWRETKFFTTSILKLENIDKMFPQYYMHSDIFSKLNQRPNNGLLPFAKRLKWDMFSIELLQYYVIQFGQFIDITIY